MYCTVILVLEKCGEGDLNEGVFQCLKTRLTRISLKMQRSRDFNKKILNRKYLV